jgi:hypothetical protein
VVKVIVTFIIGLGLSHLEAIAMKPVDIYLTSNRICRKCTGRYISPSLVELSNPAGQTMRYPIDDIMGVDLHPVWRRFFKHSVGEIGYPARQILPQAFDEERYLLQYP